MRSSEWIHVPELPWPLRFSFLRVEEDDGCTRWALVGFEPGQRFPETAWSHSTRLNSN